MVDLPDLDPIYLSLQSQGEVTVAAFKLDRITEEDNIEQLGHELFSIVDQLGCRKLAMDMGNVEYITSSVIGKLISLHRKLHRNDGLLILCCLNPKLEEVLRTSRLIDYFQSVPTVDEAVARLGA
jgi:anti-sigma B factor antagonist